MGMLAVHDGLPECAFTRLEKKRVSTVCDCGRIEANHRSKHEASTPHLVNCAEHTPVSRIELVAPSWTALLRPDEERLSHPHQVPTAQVIHQHRHRPG